MERGVMTSLMEFADPPKTDLYTFLSAGIRKQLSHPALTNVETKESMTFGQLEERLELVAKHLMADDFQKGSTLVMYSGNSLEYLIMACAALRLGGHFACVSCMSTPKELHRLIELCDGDFIFTSSEVVDNAVQAVGNTTVKKIYVNGKSEGCVSYCDLLESSDDLPILPPMASIGIDPDREVSCVLFSSGTTGLPKAVKISHTNMISSCFGLSNPATSILRMNNIIFVPMSHIFGVGIGIFGLSLGQHQLVMSRFNPTKYLETIQEYKVSILHIVPPIAVLLAKSPITDNYDLSHVNVVVCAAAPLSGLIQQQLVARLKGKDCKVVNLYGMTETTGATTGHYVDENLRPGHIPPAPLGSVGLLMAKYQGKVINIRTGAILGPNQDGELLFRGPQVMLGYQKNDEATQNMIDSEGWIHTGDIGHVDEHGYYFIVDRLKELIKYKGYQVAPAELEELLLSRPDIDDCGVVGLPDEEAGELPMAWVVPKPNTALTPQDVIKFVEENASAYKKLRGGVSFVEAIPKSASGKILRREIRRIAIESKEIAEEKNSL